MQKGREADMLKSTFLANMSHEIRTPLNAIVGFSGIIAEMDDEEERDEYVKIINTNCDLLLRLVTDILDFSKIESGMMDYSLADVNIKEICAEQYKVHSPESPGRRLHAVRPECFAGQNTPYRPQASYASGLQLTVECHQVYRTRSYHPFLSCGRGSCLV